MPAPLIPLIAGVLGRLGVGAAARSIAGGAVRGLASRAATTSWGSRVASYMTPERVQKARSLYEAAKKSPTVRQVVKAMRSAANNDRDKEIRTDAQVMGRGATADEILMRSRTAGVEPEYVAQAAQQQYRPPQPPAFGGILPQQRPQPTLANYFQTISQQQQPTPPALSGSLPAQSQPPMGVVPPPVGGGNGGTGGGSPPNSPGGSGGPDPVEGASKSFLGLFGTLGKVTSGVVTFVKSMDVLGSTLVERQRRMAEFNGTIAGAMAQLDAGRLRLDIQKGAGTARSTAALTGAKLDLEKSLQPFSIAASNALNRIATLGMRIASTITAGVSLLPGMKQLLAKMAQDEGDSIAPWQDFLSRVANGQMDKPAVNNKIPRRQGGAAK